MYQNNNTYRIIAFSLALLMFMTSVSFAVDMHYCQGNLKSFSLFGKAKNCHEMAQAKAACPHHAKVATTTELGCSISKKDCCENKTFYFQFDENQETQTNEWAISPTTQLFLVAYITTFISPTRVVKSVQHHFLYKPPLLRLHRLILFQSFLL